jgi:hypothetical protein
MNVDEAMCGLRDGEKKGVVDEENLMREFLELMHLAHEDPELKSKLPTYEDCLNNHALIDLRLETLYEAKYGNQDSKKQSKFLKRMELDLYARRLREKFFKLWQESREDCAMGAYK